MPKKNDNILAPAIDGEDPLLYKRQEKELLNYFKPARGAEAGLIRRIALHGWMAQRAIRKQQEYLVRTKWVMGRDFDLLLRYQSTNERSARKMLKFLLSLRKKAALSRIGFVSQTPQEPITLSKIYPHISDRWAHNTAVLDKKTNTFILLKVLRDREREENERRLT